jgi:hypothetical protein
LLPLPLVASRNEHLVTIADMASLPGNCARNVQEIPETRSRSLTMSSVPRDLHQADFDHLNTEFHARGWKVVGWGLGPNHVRIDFQPLNATAADPQVATSGHDFANARANVLKRIEQETSSTQ